jgi:hypothetical protein
MNNGCFNITINNMSERIPLESNNTIKPVLRGHPWDKEKVVF